MKVKNGEIYQTVEPLKKLMQEKMPVRTSYGIAKLVNKLAEPLKVIEDVRSGLVKKYGKQDGAGQGWKVEVGTENFEKFTSEFTELLDQEVQIVFDKVRLPEKIAATCDACHHNMDKEFEIEPIILMALDKFVEIKE